MIVEGKGKRLLSISKLFYKELNIQKGKKNNLNFIYVKVVWKTISGIDAVLQVLLETFFKWDKSDPVLYATTDEGTDDAIMEINKQNSEWNTAMTQQKTKFQFCFVIWRTKRRVIKSYSPKNLLLKMFIYMLQFNIWDITAGKKLNMMSEYSSKVYINYWC